MNRRQLLANFPIVMIPVLPISKHLPVPHPRFYLYQEVKAFYDLEEYPDLVEARGVVVGLRYQPENWSIEVGWVYDVKFHTPDEEWSDEIAESKLEAC